MREAYFLLLRLDAQDLEVHLLSERGNIFGSVHTLVRKFRDVAETLESFTKLDEDTKIGESRNLAPNHIAGPMGGDKAFPSAGREVLHRKRQALAATIDTGDDRLDLLVFFQNILG